MEVNRPSTKKQTSRKGKKAWRKNIDIDDVEISLEEKREQIRTLGEEVDKIDSNQLFSIDTAGDNKLKKKAVKPYKVLKSHEILAQRSKAPGYSNPHKKSDNKIDGVKKKEIHRLMKLAGRVQGETSTNTIIDKEGLVNTNAYDVWGAPEAPKDPKPEILEKFSDKGWTKPKTLPKTLKESPIQVEKSELIPNAGKSYNPSLESWKSLINQEYTSVKEREDKKQALEAQRIKLEKLLATAHLKEEEDSDDDNEDEDEDEEEQDEDDEDAYSLSVNKPVVNKKKTKTQRNKQKKHQERVKIEQELKSLKKQITELQKLSNYEDEINAKELQLQKSDKKDKKRKTSKLGTKHNISDKPVDVKLSDELTDSLRKLKSEGNLLHDTMRGLQTKGKVETRIPVGKRRRYQPKVTEKWTYKDFK
ncbi:hypothetical protein BN7_6234 [Wickerhamomyces ciferrii]|uniref:Ribosome biogenesis protein NOP53 n=1 Tax=Wickerhamomyces ciferrii (strain ATCC 14091 / BCRC 22168 / CBS 111 / JCM 3599 / NBRC 0793 / NRRL Y-1031 F-60-10) TaxID=1206466 RepID=K0KZ41_WICCF|nr:uncharacterized protein BN7_6234 [Wickerhamomyces ciferrii]CCH46639.1 hypothetical protein BN7_6234 [Wickerhamomyces ciferrii]